MATPTVRRLLLGNELRRLREDAGTTPAEAARVLGCNVTKISRIELGQSGLAIGDVKLLLEAYGDDPGNIEAMMELARGNRERGRWSGHRGVLPAWFRPYVDLECDAEDIRLTEVEVVPGLLQTEAYMRALFEGATTVSWAPVDVEGAIKSRRERQEALDRDDPPMLSCILSESCVRRIVGGRAVMAEQVQYLAEVAGRPRVQIQLRPFDDEGTTMLAMRFIMLRIPTPGAAPPLSFVYCEDFDNARYIDDKDTVRRYEELWGTLQAGALGPVETQRRLRELALRYSKGLPDDPR